jgi:hypothetical protein
MINISTQELLLAQIKAYLVLAKQLKSSYYLGRAKSTLELYYAERNDRTAILNFQAA